MQPTTLPSRDEHLQVLNPALLDALGGAGLLGNWFVFLSHAYIKRSLEDAAVSALLEALGQPSLPAKPVILFRGRAGRDRITLPGGAAALTATDLPRPSLVSLTSDKALYRTRDTVRLLLAAPREPGSQVKLTLTQGGSVYGTYPLALDQFGLSLWQTQGLPEGQYEARFEGKGETSEAVSFEVAEYRLVPLHAELREQDLKPGGELHYTLAVTAFGEPYSGRVEIEIMERGAVRVGKREQGFCDALGLVSGVVHLTGAGPYALNVYAGERTATVPLKGSEQERRESVVVGELGTTQELQLLPTAQAQECRGMYIARGGANTEPFLVRTIVGSEVEVVAREAAELLRVVVVDPACGTVDERLYEQVVANTPLRLPVPSPYGIVLLGAFIGGKAWEGWCAVLRPSDLQLRCAVKGQVKPGSRVKLAISTGTSRAIPVHLLVKDGRLRTASDPLLDLAAAIKKNLAAWRQASVTGRIARRLADLDRWSGIGATSLTLESFQSRGRGFSGVTMGGDTLRGAPRSMNILETLGEGGEGLVAKGGLRTLHTASVAHFGSAGRQVATKSLLATGTQPASALAAMPRLRVQFPEVVYNAIVQVSGSTEVEVQLGEGVTQYSVEAFALDPQTMDWQRAEIEFTATQPLYGELTVSPFVFRGDVVTGRLDTHSASGTVVVEVCLDDDPLPLTLQDGRAVTPGAQLPSGSTVLFPVRPGRITATVRDPHTGEADVTERFVTEPGKLRHVARRLRLLTPGDGVSLRDPGVIAIRPVPSLERPFQAFVGAASQYPHGCIEQTSTKLLAMLTGYLSNMDQPEVARGYEAAIPAWYRRLKSMALPGGGFCMYPPEESGTNRPDTHYAPLAVRHLLGLPTGAQSGAAGAPVREMLDDIRALAMGGAAYYRIAQVPARIDSCHDAYRILIADASDGAAKQSAAAFARTRLVAHEQGQVYVQVEPGHEDSRWLGRKVATRSETAYAAACLLLTGEPTDRVAAIAATNYLTGQLNEEGRLYSTVDTAACLALLSSLRAAGVVTAGARGRVMVNDGDVMSLQEALDYPGRIKSLSALVGIAAVEVTSEVTEDWSQFQSGVPVEVRLEKQGVAQDSFAVGEAVDLVVRLEQYTPGMLVHVCLPDALVRVVGGGQVKRFSADFCGKDTLRIPLAVVGAAPSPTSSAPGGATQHWAVLVRNMFKEEEVGNPGLQQVTVRSAS